MNLSPCYKCTQRHLGCHGACSLYLQFVAEREAERKMAHDRDAVERVRLESLMTYRDKERHTPHNLLRRK